MEIVVIAAVAENNVIGINNKIPWHIKEDFEHFKKLTMGHPCIMGDRTFESLPIKPLPGRINIVLSFDKNYKPEGVIVKHSFEDALKYCKNKEKVFIIGGASIYKQSLEFAGTLEITRIHKNYKGDTSFPEIDINKWVVVKKEDKSGKDINNNETIEFSFLTYKRKENAGKKR